MSHCLSDPQLWKNRRCGESIEEKRVIRFCFNLNSPFSSLLLLTLVLTPLLINTHAHTLSSGSAFGHPHYSFFSLSLTLLLYLTVFTRLRNSLHYSLFHSRSTLHFVHFHARFPRWLFVSNRAGIQCFFFATEHHRTVLVYTSFQQRQQNKRENIPADHL